MKTLPFKHRLFMKLLAASCLIFALAGNETFAAGGGAPDDFESVDCGSLLSKRANPLLRDAKHPAWSCSAPYETPVYTRPPDDSVALESLLEGAGYGASSNSDWTDMAAGNFCGEQQKEIVLLKNRLRNFSILRGPTPYPVGAFDSLSDSSHPWRAITAGNLDNDPFDEIVAVRKVTATGVPDAVVMKVDLSACDGAAVVATKTIGNPGNSDWLDAAIGNFDGTGKQIALLKAAHTNFFLAKLVGNSLDVVFSSDLDTSTAYPWKALAAGDLDGDGIDELVAAREVSDGKGATVLVYKWSGGTFKVFATSTFGNTKNSDWSSMAIGDFNGDGRAVIALVKNKHSNFAVLDLPIRSTALRVLAAADLDSVSGQEWRGLTATDWLGSDQGAAELVAVRAAKAPYRTDLFVYGNPFHRVSRDTGLADMKAQWDQIRGAPAEAVKTWVAETHTNTVGWSLIVTPDPAYPANPSAFQGDYRALVEFLEATKGFYVDGKQLRVSVSLIPPKAVTPTNCSLPADSPLTPWNELDYFSAEPNADPVSLCKDYLAWGSVVGRLAQDYPHLMSLGIDDFMHYPEDFPGELVAEMQSRMRSQAPWLSFVPTGYYCDLGNNAPDVARTFDTMLYYFRNDKAGGSKCVSSLGESSVGNAPGEFAIASAFLPAGRKLQVGTYWGTLGSGPILTTSARYDYDLVRLIRNLPGLGGVTAYPMQQKTKHFVACNEFNFLDVVDDNKFCTLQRAYGNKPQPVSQTDLTSASGAPPAAGNPFGYVFPAQGVQNVVYRATDGHAHELWRTATGIGHSDLTALASAPGVVGDPMAYVFAAQGIQNVVYRGTEAHVHGLWWSTGAVGHDDLTVEANAPAAAGAPYGYVFDALGVQNVLYRGTDGHLHGLWWSTGAVVHDDLTALSHAPPPTGNPKAYIATTYGLQNAVYRGTDGHLHGLYWSTGAVVHDDLTNASHAPSPASDPTGYFVATDGTHHVVYRSSDGHIRNLSWTTGVVSHDDLTLLAAAPLAVGNPSAYLAPDGTQHVIYRSGDGHVHDLVFGD
jgi:hypothetical protein